MEPSRKKICVVITARPSYSRIKTVLREIKSNPGLELQLVVSASALLDRYGSVINVIKADGFEPNSLVHAVVEGSTLQTSVKSTGLAIMELSSVFESLKPDVVISIADRYETIATAIASSFMNIPLAHIQGGEITGSIDDKVRHAVTKMADVHFVSNTYAYERVIGMGESPNRVFNTGCPSIDIAFDVKQKYENTLFSPFSKYKGTGNKFDVSNGYIVVMQHPVTTSHDESSSQIYETLAAIKKLDKSIFLFWPNIDSGSEEISKNLRIFQNEVMLQGKNIYFYKNLEPVDFLRLIMNSDCLVGNSSVGIRESSFLGIPTVNIGDRQMGRDRYENVIDVDYDKNQIFNAIQKQIKIKKYNSSKLYGDGTSGEKISNHLLNLSLKD